MMESVLPTLVNSSTETSASEFRRSKARHILINKVNDRTTKPTVKWHKSVSEVQINNYKNECRKVGAPSLFQRHNMIASSLCRKEESGVQPESLTMSYSYFAQGNGKRDKVLLPNEKKKLHSDMGFGLHREMSLTEIHQIMQRQVKSDVEFPKISINIHRSLQGGRSVPEVKLMLKKLPPHEFHPHRLQTPYSQVRTRTFDPPDFQKHRRESDVASDRSKLNVIPLSAVRHLQKLDRNKMTSQERARVWVQRNPLGPESAPDDLADESMQFLKRIAPLDPLQPKNDESRSPSPDSDRPKTVAIEISKPIELAPKPTKTAAKSAGAGQKSKGKDNPHEFKGKKVRFGKNSWQYHDSNDYIFHSPS